MLRDDGSIALIDFGLAKHVALKMEVTDKGLIFGTPHYMSPEQGHGKQIDARSDIYALGVMLYEMLTGKKPFDADNHMAILVHHAKAPIPKLPERIALHPAADRHAAWRRTPRIGPRTRMPRPSSSNSRWMRSARRSRHVSGARPLPRPRAPGWRHPARRDAARLGGCGARGSAHAARRSRQLREEGRIHGAGADLRVSRGPRAERRAVAPGARGAQAFRAGRAADEEARHCRISA